MDTQGSRLQAEGDADVDKTTEQTLAFLVLGGTIGVAVLAITFRTGSKGKRPQGPVIAAVVAYAFYVGAALLAGAKMPEFLREHLFDGLAPAAVVGLLVSSLLREHPRQALPWIRRPVMILVVLFAGGALIGGLIAAAAVFSSGSGGFKVPVVLCACGAGYLFAYSYYRGVSLENASADSGNATDLFQLFLREGWEAFRNWRQDWYRWPRFTWWFTKRPKHAATPELGGPGDVAALAAAYATEDGAQASIAGEDVPASPDESQAGKLAGSANPLKDDPLTGAGGDSR